MDHRDKTSVVMHRHCEPADHLERSLCSGEGKMLACSTNVPYNHDICLSASGLFYPPVLLPDMTTDGSSTDAC